MTDPSDTFQHAADPSAKFTRDQWGWLVAALVAFVGVVFIGPAVTSAAERGRTAGRRVRRRIRRLGGGTIGPWRHRIRALAR